MISPLHDIPLRPGEASDVFNLVIEVPRWTNAKMEVSENTETKLLFQTKSFRVWKNVPKKYFCVFVKIVKLEQTKM